MTRRELPLFLFAWPLIGRDRGRRRFGDSRSSIVGRTMSDLRSVASRNFIDGHERRHFERAMEDLDRFQYRWSRDGRFDTGRLDSAIRNIEDLARAHQIHPRDRQILGRDLRALRQFRGDTVARW